jgi:AcrR family transcriptional regulator
VKKPADTTVDVVVDNSGWRSKVVSRSLETAMKRSLDRSEAFITAAIELLHESGESFTVEQVSERAGFSTRMFYQHFSGKHELLLAVIEEETRQVEVIFRKKLESEPDPVRRLARLLKLLVGVKPDPHILALLKHEMVLVVDHPEEVAHTQAPLTALLREIISEATAAGALRVTNENAATYLVFSLKRAYNHSTLLGDDLGLGIPNTNEFIDFCIRGLGGEPPAR